MEEFCQTLDIRHISRLSDKRRKIIQDILKNEKIDVKKIPRDKQHIYYILLVYFNPDKLSPLELKGMKIQNFCSFYRGINLSDTRIKKLFYTMYNQIVIAGLNPDMSNMSNKYLKIILDIVNTVYFNNILYKYFKENNITVRTSINRRFTGLAGRCTKRGCVYDLEIATTLYINPFKKGIRMQVVNGLNCYNPLKCMLQVFVHELVHLIIFVFCADQDVPGGHGKVFKEITQSLFGHTDFRHGFGKDPEKVGLTRDELRGRKYIAFINSRTKKKVIAKIVKVNIKTVTVIPIGTTSRLKVYFSGIFKEEPVVDDDVPKTTKPITTIVQPTGVTINSLKSRKFIAWKGRDGQIKIGKIVNVRVTKVLAINKDGDNVLVPLSIILKDEPKAPKNWKESSVGITRQDALKRKRISWMSSGKIEYGDIIQVRRTKVKVKMTNGGIYLIPLSVIRK